MFCMPAVWASWTHFIKTNQKSPSLLSQAICKRDTREPEDGLSQVHSCRMLFPVSRVWHSPACQAVHRSIGAPRARSVSRAGSAAAQTGTSGRGSRAGMPCRKLACITAKELDYMSWQDLVSICKSKFPISFSALQQHVSFQSGCQVGWYEKLWLLNT